MCNRNLNFNEGSISFLLSGQRNMSCFLRIDTVEMKICSPIVSEMLWPVIDAQTLREKLWENSSQ